MKRNQTGFTIPELMVVLSVTSIFVGLILFFTFSYWRYGYLLEADLDTLTTRLNASDYLREAVGSSSGMIMQNSIPDSHTLNADPAIPGEQYWVPIHAIPGNIAVNATTQPIIYFSQYSKDAGGNYIMNGTQPYEDEFIVYLDGPAKQLKVRNLANPAASGNRLKTSCPAEFASAACPADKVIVDDLASIDLRFFSETGNLIDYTSIVDSSGNYAGPDYTSVDVLELTLNITKKPFFQKTDATFNSTVIRVGLRNS